MGELVSLNDLLSVSRDSVISIETISGVVRAREIRSQLPTGREYAGMSWDRDLPETGIDRIDELDDALGMPVFLDQRRIGLVSLGPAEDAGFHWLEFETNEWGSAVPAFEHLIASCSDIQTNSMTGGWCRWCVGHIEDQLVCFFTDIDEHGFWVELEPRGNRTDGELATELSHRAGQAAGLALRHVISSGTNVEDFRLEELDMSYAGWVCSASFHGRETAT